GREIPCADGCRVPREVEDRDREQREHDRREKRTASAKLDREIFSRDERRGGKRAWRSSHAHRATASRYASRYASSCTVPRGSCFTNCPSRMIAVCVARASPSPRWCVT